MPAKHYPLRLLDGPEFRGLVTALGGATTELRLELDELSAQLDVETATAGLSTWEEALGLSTDVSKSDTSRRERIKAKLRGTGAVTSEMLANVAKSFAGGEVTVIERPAEYKFILKFSGQYGTPPNMPDVAAALDEVKPAHLAYEFEYSYLLILDIHGVMTLAELETQTLDKFAGGS